MPRPTLLLFAFTLVTLSLLLSFSEPKSRLVAAEPSALQQLGHRLFFERRLSFNGTKSCASCHAPELAFTDGYRRSLGSTADLLQRNTPSLLNLGSYQTLNWANPSIHTIEQQMSGPLFMKHPIEMGMDSADNKVLQWMLADQNCKQALQECRTDSLNWKVVISAIAAYVGSLKARSSKYDLFQKGWFILSRDEVAGMNLFFSNKLNCVACHGGTDFNTPFPKEARFANIGLYNIGSTHLYANNDQGISNETHVLSDIGKFRIPSLRNVAITAPYFHDGSATTLQEAIDAHLEGGRQMGNGTDVGDGRLHPQKDKRLRRVHLTVVQKKQLLQFLFALTDTSYLRNPYFLPFPN